MVGLFVYLLVMGAIGPAAAGLLTSERDDAGGDGDEQTSSS